MMVAWMRTAMTTVMMVMIVRTMTMMTGKTTMRRMVMMTFVVRGASTAQQSQAPPARRPALRSEQGPRQRQERTGDSRQVCNLCERQRQGRSPLAGLTRPPGPLVAPAVSARVVTLLILGPGETRCWQPAAAAALRLRLRLRLLRQAAAHGGAPRRKSQPRRL